VLIVSSMAENGAETTVRALALGAADTLPKPGIGNFAGRFQPDSRRSPAPHRPRRARSRCGAGRESPPIRLRDMATAARLRRLAASTGGLPALFEFLRTLPKKLGVPILVTQHCPRSFMSISRVS